MNTARSTELFAQAQKVIPGGVNSPVRAFKSVGGQPLFIKRGEGSRVFDEDGNSFIDYVGSWGPLILGHAHPGVVEAITRAAKDGTTFGAPTALEVELAEMIVEAVPSIDMVRLVSSGTEALMSAIRLARGFTGRDKIIKFDGCYHGHSDGLLAKAGSGIATFGLPDSAGVPASVTADTIVLPYNNPEAVSQAITAMRDSIACVVVEPVAGNMGVVAPKQGFLQNLRKLCTEHGILLLFDEVITGFRVAYGGAQELYGVASDLTTLGKIIGGGMPIGAYGGRRDIMEKVAPLGPVYQAGTLSGNPVAVSAGIATLKALQEPGLYTRLLRKASTLEQGLAKAAADARVPVHINSVGSMMTMFFAPDPISDYTSAKKSDTQKYAQFFHGMLEHGVYMAPSQFEAMFVSAVHTVEDTEFTTSAAAEVLSSM
ncbi:MAG: glutamate-1-semialdehyde 2,1-aminomutase [Armatimonadota bacterium]|nr:glutamate-1-semialdehyde 2,1-aminomutase [bacterium]